MIMKKMTKLMLTLTMLFGMVGGANAAEVKIPIELTGAVGGVTVKAINPSTLEELAENPEHIYAAKFTTSDQLQNVIQIKNMSTEDAVAQGCDRIIVEFGGTVDNAWRFHSYGGQFDGIEEIGGETTHTVMIDKSKSSIDDFTIFNWLGSGSKEIIVKAAYFYKPNDSKTLPVDLSTLPTSSESTSWAWDAEKSTGTFAWTATSWNSTELFGSGNYSAYTTLNLVTETGTADHFRIIIKFTNGAGQVTISPVPTGTVSLTLTDYTTLENLAAVQTIRLSGANNVTGDVIVSSIYLEGPNVTYIEATELFGAPAGTTDLNGMTGAGEIKWTVSYPKEMAPGVDFGVGNLDADNQSVDITSYDYLHFVVTEASAGANLGVRVFVSEENRSDNDKRHCLYPHPIAKAAEVSNWEAFSPITSAGVYVVKISDYPLLRGIKGGNSWQDGNAGTAIISQAYVSSGAPVDYVSTGKYALVGEAAGSVSLTAALADANATCYDATGVTGTSVDLTSVANPNALFVANAGALANTQNVIVDGTCANLVLTDKKPFKAPVDFTATSAAFSKTVSAADYATIVLPFDAELPLGVEAYDIKGNEGDVLTTSAVPSITANKPVMLKNAGTYEFTATDAAIKAVEGVQTNGLLNGVYATTDAPVEVSYVLQNKSGDVNFYKAAAGTKVDAFRAYLTTSAGARLTFDFNSETTDISATLNDKGEMRNDRVVYNLNGQRVEKATKGLYIKNGKKVVVR